MEHILKENATPCVGEELVASLTAGNRTKWAQARQLYFARGVNKMTLYIIESAAFVLSLDEEPYEFDIKHPEKLDKYGQLLLHGNGHDRWFDKSFTLCIGKNGRVSLLLRCCCEVSLKMYIFFFVTDWFQCRAYLVSWFIFNVC
jgi:carnitine O-palmitoyltransferase 1, liver isoform